MNGEVATIPRDMGMQAAARRLGQMHVSGAPVMDETVSGDADEPTSSVQIAT